MEIHHSVLVVLLSVAIVLALVLIVFLHHYSYRYDTGTQLGIVYFYPDSISVGLAFYASMLVTYQTILSDSFEPSQKYFIVLLSWLIPILGPLFILNVLASDKLLTLKRGVPFLDFVFLTGIIYKNTYANEDSEDFHLGAGGSYGDDSD